MNRKNFVLGFILIIIGGLFLLSNLDVIDISIGLHWSLALLVPGLIFEISYFSDRNNPGLLVPGGILITYGILFYIMDIYGWGLMGDLWPVFPLGVAIGLFQLYIFADRDAGLLVPVGILGGFSVISLLANTTKLRVDFNLILAIVFIIVGLVVILRRK
ncbi:LiaI-LiaF-like domain-containing protein [Dethiothermospora halolimnae]|uniref:LiaI-LiaF-like domain-containing protein n=1 Tax=Dethiothermospora halolimnae TaxID=3114390 RepID=UPI003CCBED24